jgi:hypothetical protein
MNWDDVNARVRGLGLHLLGSVELAALAAAIDIPALAAALEARGFRVPADPTRNSPRNWKRQYVGPRGTALPSSPAGVAVPA